MAADSIAKLAVIITGDASPLSAALNKAKGDVTGWASGLSNMKSTPFGMVSNDGIDRWATGLRNLKSQEANVFEGLRTGAAKYAVEAERAAGATFRMSMALQAARGNVGAISNLVQSGGLTGGLVAAGVAAGILAFKLASISDAQRIAASGGETLNTWTGQWDRVQKSASSIAATLGRPIADVLARETGQIASIMEGIASSILPDQLRQEQQKIAILSEQNRLTEAQAKIKRDLEHLTRREVEQFKQLDKERIALRAQHNIQGGLGASDAKELRSIQNQERSLLLASQLRKAEEEFGRNLQADLDALSAKANALSESLRTPKEEFVAALREANELFDAGKISAGLLERAATSAGVKFLEADKIRKRIQEAERGVAATDRFTMAGFSAVQQGQRELQHIEQVAKEQLEEQKRQTAIEQEIATILNDRLKNPIVLMEGTPP